MNAALKGCAIAATLLGACALAAAPAFANSLHNEGNFGGT